MPFGVNPITGRPGPAPAPGRDGDVLQARARVNVLVQRGEIPHPNDRACVDCWHVWVRGKGNRHEYDHHKGYDAIHHLDVEPVCKRCHVKRDNKKAKQTHCSRGHEFTAANTYRKTNGTRACRACMRLWDKARGARGSDFWRRVNERRGRSGRHIDRMD